MERAARKQRATPVVTTMTAIGDADVVVRVALHLTSTSRVIQRTGNDIDSKITFAIRAYRVCVCMMAPPSTTRARAIMDKHRTEGTKHEIKGAVKEGVGKVTNNPLREAEGKIEKHAGKAEKEYGKAKDEARKEERHDEHGKHH
jgi:uncharacterized protein YjbJ (UPF0337 family)